MCTICVQFGLDKLTKEEAKQALMELIQTEQIDQDHIFEVAGLIENGNGS